MIYIISYALFCIAFAWLNSFLIKRGKRIFHALNGLLHIAAAVAGWYYWGWQIGVSILFVARLFFDVALNLFRGLPIDYVSPEVMRYNNLMEAIDKGKVIDFVEYKIFGDSVMPKLIYLSVIVLIQFL